MVLENEQGHALGVVLVDDPQVVQQGDPVLGLKVEFLDRTRDLDFQQTLLLKSEFFELLFKLGVFFFYFFLLREGVLLAGSL